MKQLFLLATFLISGLTLQAQFGLSGMSSKPGVGKITGGIMDSLSKQPMEYVTVSLRTAGTTKPIDGVITDKNGKFELKNIKNGKYDVFITFIGYQDKLIPGVSISDSISYQMLGKMNMSPSQQVLDGVTITGQKSIVENKIDKLVYNASTDATNRGGNAGDVLRKVPTLSVDLDGNLYMRGSSNIKVLINGKPSAVMASNVSEALKMIPSDEIDKVEVITSPGAKYDAEGSAGIVNIITKRKTIKGVSGMLNASIGTRSQFAGGNVNVKYDKWGFNTGIGAFGWKADGSMDASRTLPGVVPITITQSGANNMNGLGGRLSGGIDYDITDRDNINASVGYRQFGMNLDNNITSVQTFGSIASSTRRAMDSENKNKALDVNLDYKHKFARENQELTISGQFSNSGTPNNYEVHQYNISDILDYQERSLNDGSNREITAQADYTHPFTKTFTLDGGVKGIFRRVESIYNFDTLHLATNEYLDDAGRSSAFGYLQDVYAGYAEATWYIGKNWGLKAGVRYEATTNKGDLFQSERSLDQKYDNWLPSGTLSYKFGASSIKASYNQRLQRPGLFHLNPYSNQSDYKNITVGNPNLVAELTHNMEIGYNTYFGISSINLSLYNRITNNAIEAVKSIRGDTIVTSYFNQAKNANTGLNLSGNLMFGYKFMLSGNFDVSYVNIENKSLGITNSGINYGVNGFVNWTLVDVWGVQGFAGFRGPSYTAQGKSTSYYYYGLGVKRDLLNKQATLSVGLDNFLTPTQKITNEYEINGLKYSSVSTFKALGARVSFFWRFGKMKFTDNNKQGINNSDILKGSDNQGAGGRMN